MTNSPKIYEDKLIDIWQAQSFTRDLKTNTGEVVNVLDIGIYCKDSAGPDFKNARIRIGNLVYVGDIEIDCDYINWKSHGHNIDKKYNKVILHACLSNRNNHQYVYTKDGRRVPTICLSRYLRNDSVRTITRQYEKQNSNKKLRCSHGSNSVDFYAKKKFVSNLGIKRFDKKCNRIYKRLKELVYIKELRINEPVIKYDLKPEFDEREFSHKNFEDKELWQQLLYELIFEALGFSRNKSIMTKLAQSASVNFLKKLGSGKEIAHRFESVLMNLSGIVPDNDKIPDNEMLNYSKQLNEEWQIIKRIYDGKTFNKTDWHFFRLRPQNFPTVRIAAGSIFLKSLLFEDLIQIIAKKFDEIRNLTVLVKSLRSLFVIKSRGFWKNHYTFEKKTREEIKYFIGASRADEIVINVILPYFSVYFDIFGKQELSKKVVKVYNMYPQKSENKIVCEVAEGLDTNSFLKKTVLTQGMLELFRTYCSKKKCLDCEIGKIIFE